MKYNANYYSVPMHWLVDDLVHYFSKHSIGTSLSSIITPIVRFRHHAYMSSLTPSGNVTGIFGDGGVLQTVMQGEGGGVAEIRERGVRDFIFGKLTVILKKIQDFLMRLLTAYLR